MGIGRRVLEKVKLPFAITAFLTPVGLCAYYDGKSVNEQLQRTREAYCVALQQGDTQSVDEQRALWNQIIVDEVMEGSKGAALLPYEPPCVSESR